MYIGYKISQNIACIEIQKNRILIFLKLKPSEINDVPDNARDVTNIGHFGTGDIEVSIKKYDDFENVKYLIEMAYRKVGG